MTLATILSHEAADDDDGEALLLLSLLGQPKSSNSSFHQYRHTQFNMVVYTVYECFSVFRFISKE